MLATGQLAVRTHWLVLSKQTPAVSTTSLIRKLSSGAK